MLGIVPDDIFDALASDATHESVATQSQALAVIQDAKPKGRGKRLEVPEEIRELVAKEVIEGSRAKDVADAFGISESSISAYKNGATSTASYNEPEPALAEANNKVRTEIISTARARLMSALTHITSDKLADAKLKDVASVAKDMSVIIKNFEPDIKESNDRGSKFVFFAPLPTKEEIFDTVYSKE